MTTISTTTTPPEGVEGRSHPDGLDDGGDGRAATSPRTSSSPSPSSSTVTELHRLLMCDDVLRLTLSYLDLPSLIRFATGTSRILRRRLLPPPPPVAPPPPSIDGYPDDDDDDDDVCCCRRCWRDAFDGHNLSPIEGDDDDDRPGGGGVVVDYCHYRDALRLRLSLWSNLRGGGGGAMMIGARGAGGGDNKRRVIRRRRLGGSLPGGSFRFRPMVPEDAMTRHPPPPPPAAVDDDDGGVADLGGGGDGGGYGDPPPPVEFSCDCFCLTSPGTGSGYALLDPFSGSLAVYDGILDQAGAVVASPSSSNGGDDDDDDDGGGGRTIANEEERTMMAGGHHRRIIPPPGRRRRRRGDAHDAPPRRRRQTLFSVDDYFDLDLEEYFGRRTPFFSFDGGDGGGYDDDGHLGPGRGRRHRQRRRDGGEGLGRWGVDGGDDGGATVEWIGVDAHVAIRGDGTIGGSVVGAARTISMEGSPDDRRRRGRQGEGGGEWGGGSDDHPVVTEILAWCDFDIDGVGGGGGGIAGTGGAAAGRGRYDRKYVCRAAGSFHCMDVCASHLKVYVAFQAGRCPFLRRGGGAADYSRRAEEEYSAARRRRSMDIEEEEGSIANEDCGDDASRSVFRLPLVRYADHPPPPSPSSPESAVSYFPPPDAIITAQYPVSSFSVDSTGDTVLIGTVRGTVEVWRTGTDIRRRPGVGGTAPAPPRRLQILSVREFFVRRRRAMTVTVDARRGGGPVGGDDDDDGIGENVDVAASRDDDAANGETRDDLVMLDDGGAPPDGAAFPHKHPTSAISRAYIPRHLPAQRCGFVTCQRCPRNGTTLLLWQTRSMSSDDGDRDIDEERFGVTAMINLPLSVRCHPAVHFDGRRLIVYGKDHIGLIILIYHVLGTRYDQNEFDESSRTSSAAASLLLGGKEESGGVVQLLPGERRIAFVNRVRHAGLGGLEYFDSMLMAANERFVIANTKTGNLVGSDGARNATDGLLVIDLLQQV